MAVIPNDFTTRSVELIESYLEAGGVLDYVPLRSTNEEVRGLELHAEAAYLALELVRWDDLQIQLEEAESIAEPVRLEPFFVDRNQLNGKEISVDEFVGPFFDGESQRLVVRGRTADHRNDLFLAGESESSENALQIVRRAETAYVTCGYADAFSAPPHGIKMEPATLNRLFLDINQELFGGLHADGLEIYSWSPDSCSFFDEGREWWGSFFWTVLNASTRQLCAILGSASD